MDTNPRAERNALIDFMSHQPQAAISKIMVDDLQTSAIAATFDHLDPDCACFIRTPTTRALLLAATLAYIATQVNDFMAPDETQTLAVTPNMTELRRDPAGNLILIENGMSATHYAPTQETNAWRAFTAQATFEATGCPF